MYDGVWWCMSVCGRGPTCSAASVMLEVIDSCSSYLPVDMFKTQPNISHYTPCAVLQSCRAHQGMAYLPGFTSMVLPGATSATAAAML